MTLYKLAPMASFVVFRFPDPDTKYIHRGANFKELVSNIRLYRAQNELEELEYLESAVEHYLCKLPDHRGSCERGGYPLKRGIIPFLKGGLLLLKNLAYNQFVTQEVADARSEKCVTCPLNYFPDKTKFVKWSDELAIQTVGERRASRHDDIGTCEACGCPLRCKVWFGGKFHLKPEEETKIRAEKPDCWQLPKEY